MMLDLGAIAKGYAADEAAVIAIRSGVNRGIVNLGGNVVTFGIKRDRSPWRIGIQSPDERHGGSIGYVQTREPFTTVVTSGIYQRFFEKDGIHYHHIFSPETGYPVQNELYSVTIIIGVSHLFSSMDADALSTAVFVLGYERGLTLVNSLPGVEAVFVFKDRSIRTTPGVNFTLTDRTFTLRDLTMEAMR
jgi:thiamine biosynthesis lipoprotein